MELSYTPIFHLSMVMFFSIVGNMFFLFVLWRGKVVQRRRLSPVQRLLIHTCAADLWFALISLGTEIYILLQYPSFPGPPIICKFVRYIQAVPLYASPFLLVAISADRYQAICKPLANYRRNKSPKFYGTISWALAIAFAMPQYIIWKGGNNRCSTIYGVESSLRTGYVIYFTFLAWLIPTFMSAYYYIQIGFAVCKSKKLIECADRTTNYQHSESMSQMSNGTKEYVERLRKRSEGFKTQRSEFDRKRNRTVLLTLIIVVLNLMLWAPFVCANFAQIWFPEWLSPFTITLMALFGNLNSCVNPYIYIIFNWKTVKQVFCACGKENGRPSSYRSNTSTLNGLENGVNNNGYLKHVSFEASSPDKLKTDRTWLSQCSLLPKN
ncbi:unnamed protein product [Bursaphelenchus xylophilus]|uniref:(pine wood nematode) hypothetical protein n=1 Tax=Bursaphelenchus xylophilus TaxID=6326 RepID=A0A1I7S9P0_BURXY|nr:unnamed protein product [Bursaphelenchus xylophilus]CAG9131915.1 unnamed protein product [Bursaphelenchus xylophilus]